MFQKQTLSTKLAVIECYYKSIGKNMRLKPNLSKKQIDGYIQLQKLDVENLMTIYNETLESIKTKIEQTKKDIITETNKLDSIAKKNMVLLDKHIEQYYDKKRRDYIKHGTVGLVKHDSFDEKKLWIVQTYDDIHARKYLFYKIVFTYNFANKMLKKIYTNFAKNKTRQEKQNEIISKFCKYYNENIQRVVIMQNSIIKNMTIGIDKKHVERINLNEIIVRGVTVHLGMNDYNMEYLIKIDDEKYIYTEESFYNKLTNTNQKWYEIIVDEIFDNDILNSNHLKDEQVNDILNMLYDDTIIPINYECVIFTIKVKKRIKIKK